MQASSGNRVAVVGGGVAALETVLALRDLTDGEASITLVSPEPDFTYRPLLVREPFSADTADRVALRPALEELGADFLEGAVDGVDPDGRSLRIEDGRELPFDYAVICAGARMVPALPSAHTLWIERMPTTIDRILADTPADGTVSLIVPPGVSWPLPLYEFALMTARRLREGEDRGIGLAIYTPEHSPLAIFGVAASEEVERLLRARGVELHTDVWVREEDGEVTVGAAERGPLEGTLLALPLIEGRKIAGLPEDARGFIPIDDHARVIGLDRIFAAGDGTSFPIKQGGIATQQADAAAEAIAAELGHDVEPAPFHPVLRGKLLTGEESVNLRFDVGGGEGEGTVSSDYLWWPPHKVSGRYIAPWLAHESLHGDLEPPVRSVDVEVAIRQDWHSEPIGLDPGRRRTDSP